MHCAPKAGGECITFDKLAMRSPLGQGTVLLRGPVKDWRRHLQVMFFKCMVG